MSTATRYFRHAAAIVETEAIGDGTQVWAFRSYPARRARLEGRSAWTLRRRLRYAFDSIFAGRPR